MEKIRSIASTVLDLAAKCKVTQLIHICILIIFINIWYHDQSLILQKSITKVLPNLNWIEKWFECKAQSSIDPHLLNVNHAPEWIKFQKWFPQPHYLPNTKQIGLPRILPAIFYVTLRVLLLYLTPLNPLPVHLFVCLYTN